MATVMRSLEFSNGVGRRASAVVVEVSAVRPVSCAWKGLGFKAGGVSGVSVRREVKVKVGVRSSVGASGGGGALTPALKEALDKYVSENKVVLFMKGNRMFPQCGFSNTCVQILNTLEVPYETVNVLEDESLRQGVKEYSAWPTFPQLYIDGQFFGGCDITLDSYSSGELQEVLEKAMLS